MIIGFNPGEALLAGNYSTVLRRVDRVGDLIWERPYDIADGLKAGASTSDFGFILTGNVDVFRIDRDGEPTWPEPKDVPTMRENECGGIGVSSAPDGTYLILAYGCAATFDLDADQHSEFVVKIDADGNEITEDPFPVELRNIRGSRVQAVSADQFIVPGLLSPKIPIVAELQGDRQLHLHHIRDLVPDMERIISAVRTEDGAFAAVGTDAQFQLIAAKTSGDSLHWHSPLPLYAHDSRELFYGSLGMAPLDNGDLMLGGVVTSELGDTDLFHARLRRETGELLWHRSRQQPGHQGDY